METKEVMILFESYLTSNLEKEEKNPYWNEEEQEKGKNYDVLKNELQPSLYGVSGSPFKRKVQK